MSLSHGMVSSRWRAEDCPSLRWRVAVLPLWLPCSDMLGPPVLLSYYVVCVISCGPGALSSLWPFLGCHSGSSELAWGFRGTPSDIWVALSCFRMRSSSSPLPQLLILGDSMLCLFLALFPSARLWCPLLSPRVFVTNIQAPPLLLGLRALLYWPNQHETIAMGDLYPVREVRGYLVRFGFTSSVRRAVPFFAALCNRKELSKTSVSFWLRMPLSRESCLSATEQSVSCPLSSVLSCYHSISSLWRTLLSSWWRCESLALALLLARLLGGCRSSVARKLPPVLCGSGTGPGLSRARSLRHSLLIHPYTDVPLGLSFLMVSACLHTYMYSDYFIEMCEYIILRFSRSFLKGNVWFFLFLSS